MKKQDLATLAMIGIGAGLLVGGCQQQKGNAQDEGKSSYEQMTPDMQGFYNSLSPDAQRKFMDMDAQHRRMAMEMLNQQGPGQNSCKGLGGCKTPAHACAGQNACKGQGGPAIQDSNKAIDVQLQNQQRGQMGNGMRTQSNG